MISCTDSISITPPALCWWSGEDYHKNSHSQYRLASEVLAMYSFKGDEIILDIGCGDGEVTRFIAKKKTPCGCILGIDASSSMIESAIKNNSQSNATFQVGWAESFQLDTLFDVIVSFSTLHWIPDQPAVWNNIRRHLKIGGQALISLNPAPRSKALTEAIDTVVQTSQFHSYFHHFVEKSLMPPMSIEEYTKIIQQTSLRVDICKQSFKYFEYENATIFTHNLKAWLPHIAQVPKELQESFITAIVDEYLNKTNQNANATVKLEYNNFIIQATRIN